MNMKEIMAFIRMNKIGITKQLLVENGFPSLTVASSRGRGKHTIVAEAIHILFEADGELPANELGTYLSEAVRLIPRRSLFLIVDDDKVALCVKTIIEANQTHNPGDGRIFVMPITESWNIRTGQQICCEVISG